MGNNKGQVIAVVSPRSLGGLSIFENEIMITSDNVGEFHSENSDIQRTINQLEKLGFNILSVGPISISFAGPLKLFRDVFGVKLRKEKVEVLPGEKVDYFEADQDDAERLLQPPKALETISEGLAIARPPELYQSPSPFPPIAKIDPSAYRYFFVPDDIAVMLRATRVHRLGVTGHNIVIAMIDSGHYKHKFFTEHGYRLLPTLLGPLQTNPSDDSVGHGTGESANIFAAAPDIRLRPIKGLEDPVGDFQKAVSSTPTPQIITNSWGFSIDDRSWPKWKETDLSFYNYLKLMEAEVANAIASGIIVCFSCGNGTKRGFPSSHPEVISVGGVHVNHPDLTLEASSYASSFPSSLYPGRHCPDICGLTGKAVKIGAQWRAPSIMLPVQSGANLDQISPSTGASDDGWGLFSGTSAACPQVAGIVALMIEKNPGLTPAQVKQKLMDTARDVQVGNSGTGESAGPGSDDATGAGLVDGKWAYLVSMSDVFSDFISATPETQKEMLDSGQMPKAAKEFFNDIMDTLRSK